MLDSLLGRKFTAKCKHYVKRVNSRVGLIRKKKEAMIGFLKNDIAHLLANGHESNAFERMDGLIFEMNQVSCYNMIEQCCQSIRSRLPLLQKQRDCPQENIEAVATIIFAAARFSDLPELCDLRHAFTARYGSSMESSENKEFVAKVTTKFFSKDMKLRIMQDIAKDFSVAWDHKLFGQEKPIPSSINQSEKADISVIGRNGVITGPGQDVPQKALPMPSEKGNLLTTEPLASSYGLAPPSILLNKNCSMEKDGISSWERVQTVDGSASRKAAVLNAGNKHEANNSRATVNDNAGRQVLSSRGDSERKHELDVAPRQVDRTSRSNNTTSVDFAKRIRRKATDETENVKPPTVESAFSSHVKLRSVENLSDTEAHHEMRISRQTTHRTKEDLHHHNPGLNASGHRQPKCEKVKNMMPPYVKPNSTRVEECLQNASTCVISSSQQKPNSSHLEKLVTSVKFDDSETNFALPHERTEVLKHGKSTSQVQICKSDNFSTIDSQQDIDHATREKKPFGSGMFGDDTTTNRNPPYVKSEGHKAASYREGCHRAASFGNSMYQHGLDSSASEKPKIRENKHVENNSSSHVPSKANTRGKQMANTHDSDLSFLGNFSRHRKFNAHDDKDLPKGDPARDQKVAHKCASSVREIIYTKKESKIGIIKDGEFDVYASRGLPKYELADKPGRGSASREQTEVMDHGDVASRNRMSKYDKSNDIDGNLPKRYPANTRTSERGFVRRKHATFTEFADMSELCGFYDDYADYDSEPYEDEELSSQNRTRLRRFRQGSSSRKHLNPQASLNDEESIDLARTSPKITGSRRHNERQGTYIITDDCYDPDEINLDRLLIQYSNGTKGAAGQVEKLRARPKHPPLNYSAQANKAKGPRSNGEESIRLQRVPSALPEYNKPSDKMKPQLRTVSMQPEWWT